MKTPILAVTNMDNKIAELVHKSDHKVLVIWAADCAKRVLLYFEEKYPEDKRPRKAIEACRKWTATEKFKMADVRKTALAAHSAAREVEIYNPACSAARAAGQAISTVHVPTHAIAAAIYAATAVRDKVDLKNAENLTITERNWQYQHLLDLQLEN